MTAGGAWIALCKYYKGSGPVTASTNAARESIKNAKYHGETRNYDFSMYLSTHLATRKTLLKHDQGMPFVEHMEYFIGNIMCKKLKEHTSVLYTMPDIKTIDLIGQYFATHLACLPNGGRDQRNAYFTHVKEKRKGGHKDMSCARKARRAGQFNENYGQKAGKSYNKLAPEV